MRLVPCLLALFVSSIAFGSHPVAQPPSNLHPCIGPEETHGLKPIAYYEWFGLEIDTASFGWTTLADPQDPAVIKEICFNQKNVTGNEYSKVYETEKLGSGTPDDPFYLSIFSKKYEIRDYTTYNAPTNVGIYDVPVCYLGACVSSSGGPEMIVSRTDL